MSQSVKQSVAGQYLESLTTARIPFKSLMDVRKHVWSPNEMLDVLGVAKSVNSGGECGDKAFWKKVILIDPSLPDGLEVVVRKPFDWPKFEPLPIIEIGDIYQLKITRGYFKERHQKDYIEVFLCEEPHTIKGFEIYVVPCAIPGEIDETTPVPSGWDPSIHCLVRKLELWFCHRLLSNTLSKVSRQVKDDGSKFYADLVVFPLKKHIMECSMVVSFFDGTITTFPILDPFNQEYEAIHQDGWSEQKVDNDFLNKLPEELVGHVNVWNCTDELSSRHFEIAAYFDLNWGDFLIFFNIEVNRFVVYSDDEKGSKDSGDSGDPSVKVEELAKLDLRSGLYQGKAVRIVRRRSMMGKMFSTLISQRLRLQMRKAFESRQDMRTYEDFVEHFECLRERDAVMRHQEQEEAIETFVKKLKDIVDPN